MSDTYFDFDSPDVVTTHEALEEDEELRQVLEQCVATASTMVWRQVARECADMMGALTEQMHRLFPSLMDEPQASLLELAQRVGLTVVLFLLSLWFLAPSSTRRKSSHNRNKHHRSWMFSNVDDSVGSERGNSEESSIEHIGWDNNDPENDDERFEKYWLTDISISRYRKLVLPPTCRKVEKPSSTSRVGAAMIPTNAQPVRESSNAGSNNDDNPTARFQSYLDDVLSWMGFDYPREAEERKDSGDANSVAPTSDEGDEPVDTSESSEVPPSPENLEWFQSPVSDKRRVLEHPPTLVMSTSPSKFEEEKKDGGAASPERRNSDLTLYHETSPSAVEDGETSTPDVPRQPLVQIRKNKDALISYRKCHDKLPKIQISSSSIPQPDQHESEEESTQDTKTETAEEASTQSSPGPRSQRYFFSSVNSDESMKRLQIDVPVPDKNGYILGDDFLPDNRFSPLLVFVNSRSGPQQGQLLITQLRRLLNPIQVWDLADGAPDPILESFCALTRLRILVCGGDGTVSWIVSCLEKLNLERKWPPIAILPLGTGNDLARVLGWGGGYNNESLIATLEQISESYVSLLDRWEVTVDEKSRKDRKNITCFNYLGVGADAQAALQVHNLRESRPEWFFSRIINKAFYGVFGAEDIIKATSVHVRKEIKLIADGVEIPLPADSQGIILLNIDSYAGGVPLWSHGIKVDSPEAVSYSPRRTQSLGNVTSLNRRSESIDRVDSLESFQDLMSEEDRIASVTACDKNSSYQDGYLDVVSIRGAFHLGQIKVGLSNAQRLCQCREAVITIKSKVAVQVDGEPWRQPACTLRIRRKESPAVMLHRSADDGGVETEMSKLLDWAEERKLVDSQVHSILLKEFSRRIESKTRKRRFRAQDNQLIHTLKKAISSGAMTNMSSTVTSNQWQQGGIAF